MFTENLEIFKIVLLGSSILAAFVFYFIFSITKRQKEVIKWKQTQLAAEIATLENERKRIAGDLHDELGPVLSAVRLQVNHLEPADETERIILQKSSSQIDEVIKRFREISYDLLPNTLVRKGLVKATEEFIGRMSEAYQLRIEFTSDEVRLQPDREVNLYRILQEIIHNSVKHARATLLTIEMKVNGSQLHINTKDDGIGFNYEAMKTNDGGLGMLNLQSRVEVLNGVLRIDTQPGKGTLFFIEIPITT
jgi:two-component system, NarL family, sensor kinase